MFTTKTFASALLLLLFPMTSAAQVLPRLRLKDNAILTSNNKHASLHGINWFGFNNDQTMVDGLWAGGTSYGTDFSTIVYKLKLLGFNTVRLPFTFTDLKQSPLDKTKACHINTQEEVLKKTTYTSQDYSKNINKSKYISFQPPYPTNNVCNAYIPNTITRARLKWTVNHFIKSGFYVILDYHPMGKETIPYDPKAFVNEWVSLYKYISTKDTSGRVLLDLMNEPDSMKLSWEYLANIYKNIMSTIYAFDKQALFMVEGNGQIQYHLNWGDGFVTDVATLQQYQLNSARPFFDAIWNHSYINNLIISPHMYGPSIAKNLGYHKGSILKNRMNTSFMYLYTKGYCKKNNVCKRFPIVLGEFGSMFQEKGDIEFMTDLSLILHNMTKNPHWCYWAYNQNSGDTGGIVKNNWQDLDWLKLRYLMDKMDLKPWYASSHTP